MVTLVDGGYRFAAQEPMPVPGPQLLPWLCEPPRMQRWMPGVERLDPVEGDLRGPDGLTSVVLSTNSRFGSAGWRLTGRIVHVDTTRLVREYSLQSGLVAAPAGGSEYVRTVTYALPQSENGLLTCEVLTLIPGLPAAAARAGGRAELKSLRRALKALAQQAAGRRIPWHHRFSTIVPQAL